MFSIYCIKINLYIKYNGNFILVIYILNIMVNYLHSSSYRYHVVRSLSSAVTTKTATPAWQGDMLGKIVQIKYNC